MNQLKIVKCDGAIFDLPVNKIAEIKLSRLNSDHLSINTG